MAFWIFQTKPQMYRLLDALADEERLQDKKWLVNQHRREIRVGDGVLTWMAGPNAGVYAIAEVTAGPTMETASDDPYWEDAESANNPRLRARLRIHTVLLDRPILRSRLRKEPSLQSLSILRFSQGTNFPVTPEEWRHILALAGMKPDVEEPEEPVDAERQLDVAETHLRQALARNLSQIEPGLRAYFNDRVEEYPIPGGRIDLLCKDAQGTPVVVELKRHHWDVDRAVGQVARYMGWARKTLTDNGQVRGILLVLDEGDIDTRLQDAQSALPGLEVKKYSVSFGIA